MSAPRSMQGTAMGLFYLMDGIGNMVNLAVWNIRDIENRLIIDGVGGVAALSIAPIVLCLAENKYNLGLNRP